MKRYSNKAVETSSNYLKENGMLLSAQLESAFRNNNTNNARDIINHFGGFRNVTRVSVVDKNSIVLISTDFVSEGKTITPATFINEPASPNTNHMDYEAHVHFDEENNILINTNEIFIGSSSGSLLPDQTGLVVIEMDISNILLSIRKDILIDVWKKTLIYSLLSLMLWFMFHFLLLKRITSIVHGFANPESLNKYQLDDGKDEISVLVNGIKKINVKLNEALVRYETILNTSSVGISEVNPQGEYIFVNKAWENIFGYTSEEVMGKSTQLIIHPEEKDMLLFEKAKKGELDNYTQQRVYKTRSGEKKICELYVGANKVNGEMNSIVGVMIDITDKINAQKEAEHMHYLMKYVIDHSNSAIAIHDKNLNYIYVSRNYLKQYKIDDPNIIGKHHYEVFPDLPQKWRDVHQRVLKGEVLKADEDMYEKADGTIEWTRWECRPWMNVAGEIGGLVLYTEIITEAKKARDTIRESAIKYKTLFDTIPVGATLSDHSGKIIESNRFSEKLLGLSREEQEKRKIDGEEWVIIQPDGSLMPAEEFASVRALQENRLVENVEMGIVKNSNHTTWINVSAIPIPIENYGVLVTYSDISERKKAIQGLKENEYRYVKAQELGKVGNWEYNLLTSNFWGSEEAKLIFGFDPEESAFTTELVESCIPDRDRVHQALVDLIEKNEKYDLEYMVLPRNGEKPRFVHSVGELMLDTNGNPEKVLGVILDITERKATEDRLLLSDAHFRSLMENLQGFVLYRLYVDNSRVSAQVELVSPSISKMLGVTDPYNLEEWFVHIHPDDLERVLQANKKSLEHGLPFDQVMRIVYPEPDQSRWVQAISYPVRSTDNQSLYFNGIIIDITIRKQAEEKLIGREKEIRKALEEIERSEFLLKETGRLAKVGGWELDLETMTPYFSEETYNIYEIPQGKPPKVEDDINFYAPEARPIVQKAVADAIENQKPYDISVPFVSAKGTKKWVRTQGWVQSKNNKAVRMYGAIQDITEQKQREIELKSSEERFRAMIEGAPDPIFIQTNKCFAYLNHHAVKLFGAKHENELLGKPVLDFFHPDFHQAALERIKKLNEDKAMAHEPFEQILLQTDGNAIWVETKGEPIVYNGENGGLVFVRDITYRKNAEKELRASKALLENINNNLPGAVIQYKRFPDGTDALIYVSEGSKEIWGVRPEEAMLNGRIIWEQIDKEHVEGVKKSFEESYQNLSPWNVEFKNNLSGGIVKWIEGIGIPEKQEDGSVVWNSLMLDITERKLAELQLKEYQNSLKELTTEISLIEEKQRKEIAANIHDHLSQSLVISKMKISDIMKNKTSDSMLAELNLINNHISSALENSRKITYDLSPPILYEMGLIETMYWLADKIEEENRIAVEVKTDTTSLNLNDAQLILLYRSIHEILVNIIKHTKATNISILFSSSNEGVNIVIKDNGQGFDLKILKEKRSTAKGFGLFAVRERIQNLGGEFLLHSQIGLGTEAKIYLPLIANKL